MKVKRIHVNQHHLRANIKDPETNKPVITVKHGKDNFYGHRVKIDGPSEVIYPHRQLSCGARVWMETYSKVTIIDENTNTEVVINEN